MKYISSLVVLTLLLGITACDLQKNKNDKDSVDEKLLQLINNSSLDKNLLVITGITDDNEIDYQIYDGWEATWAEKGEDSNYLASLGEPGEEVCRGGGVSFARCVQDQLDEGKCLKLYEEDGDYVAEETMCKDDGPDPEQ